MGDRAKLPFAFTINEAQLRGMKWYKSRSLQKWQKIWSGNRLGAVKLIQMQDGTRINRGIGLLPGKMWLPWCPTPLQFCKGVLPHQRWWHWNKEIRRHWLGFHQKKKEQQEIRMRNKNKVCEVTSCTRQECRIWDGGRTSEPGQDKNLS